MVTSAFGPNAIRVGRFSTALPIMYVVAAAILIVVPILVLGIPHGADLINHYRFALPFYDSIHSGRWYPGWLADSNDGYGDPRFRFYPPGLYYALILVRTVAGSWYVGSLGTFLLISISGGVGLYLWTRELTTKNVAMWAGLLFALNPYRLNEIYQASLLSEYAACSVLPFAFLYTERICKRGRLSDIAGLAASIAALVLTHLPLTVIGCLSLGVYTLFRLERRRWPSSLIKLLLAVSLGLAASTFFWSTMLTELAWIKGNSVDPNAYYNYRVNFVFSTAALTNRNTWFANLLALAVVGFISPAIILLKKQYRSTVGNGIKAVFVTMMISFFMTTELSRPVWAIIPKLQEVQFPWRWLSITSMTGCVLLASSIPVWIQQKISKLRPRDFVAPLAFALSLVFIIGHVIVDSSYLNRAQFDSFLADVPGAVSFKDWLPVGARELRFMQKMNGPVEVAGRQVQINSWNPEHRQFQVSAGSATDARVRTFFYPLWRATSEGKPLAVRPADDGALLVHIPAEATSIQLSFEEPPRVRVSRFISAAGWVVIFSLFALGLVQSRFTAARI